MALLELRIQPGWPDNRLTMQFVQNGAVAASGTVNGATVALKGPSGAQTRFASQTVELDPADPGTTTQAGVGIIQCVDDTQSVVSQADAEIDSNGALVPQVSNASVKTDLQAVQAAADEIFYVQRADQTTTRGEQLDWTSVVTPGNPNLLKVSIAKS